MLSTSPLSGSDATPGQDTASQLSTWAQTLARDYSLYLSSAEGVETEYRRWLYLCATQGRRLQGSNWMAKAERYHRKDAASWQALTETLPSECFVGLPAPRSRDNGAAYAETLALYQNTFPDGPKFPKVWPARWREDLGLWSAHLSLLATMIGLALLLRGSGVAETLGGLVLFFGVVALTISFLCQPWKDDDSGAW